MADERSVDMDHPTEQRAPTYSPEQVEQLISEAEMATGILPPVDHSENIARGLQAAIAQLTEQVRGQQAQLPERTREWYRRDRLIHDTEDLPAQPAAPAPLAAALFVAELGRHCAALAACVNDGSR